MITEMKYESSLGLRQKPEAAELDSFWDALVERHTRSLLVIHRGRTVFERYSEGCGPSHLEPLTSLSKQALLGMALMLAVQDEFIHPDDYAFKYIPAWKTDAQKSKIKVKHLASHTAGFEFDSSSGLSVDFNNGVDPFLIAKEKASILYEPGSKNNYSNAGTANLIYALAASLANSGEYQNIQDYLKQRLMIPLGIPDSDWNMGKISYSYDNLELYPIWTSGNCTMEALAKIAKLMLEKGVWNGERIINEESIELAVSPCGLPGHAGLLWWTNIETGNELSSKILFSDLPSDAYFGAGYSHQILLIIPSLDLIVIRFGELFRNDPPGYYWSSVIKYFFSPLRALFDQNHAVSPSV